MIALVVIGLLVCLEAYHQIEALRAQSEFNKGCQAQPWWPGCHPKPKVIR